MAFATVGDHRLTFVEICIPAHGAWWGEIRTDDESDLTGQNTITVGDLSLVCTVRRGESYEGEASYRIDAGAGAWGNEVSSRGYRSDTGIMLSSLLNDLAIDTGETIASGYSDYSVGFYYVRPTQPAVRVLNALVGVNGWYIASNGETTLGSRAGSIVAVSYDVVEYRTAESEVVIATEYPGEFLPGRTITVNSTHLVINTTRLKLNDGTLRLACECSPTAESDRLKTALRAIVLESIPKLKFLGVYEYRVVTQSSETFDLQPVDTSIGLPDLERVKIRPGIPGASVDATLGSTVLLTFVNADPSRPVVVGFEDPDGDGFVPIGLDITASSSLTLGDGATSVKLGTTAVLGVARQTDQVTVGGFGGTITGGSTQVKAGG